VLRYRSGRRKIVLVGERRETTMSRWVRRQVERAMVRATEAMVEALSTFESAVEVVLAGAA